MEKKVTDLTKQEIAKMFPVVLAKHNIHWKVIYMSEKELLLKALGTLILRIEHFGSTSIANIKAKYTIDILIEISEENNFKNVIVNKLRAIGYDYILQNENNSKHMVFVKGYDATGEKGQTFHIHMGPSNHIIWERIYFRDYLIEKPELAERYESLKIILAEKYKFDRVGYRIAKTDFIQKITEEAKRYYRSHDR